MKSSSFSEWLTIATNVAVVAGIIALAIEVSQNTKQMRAQASYNLLQNRVEIRSGVIQDPELAEFWLRIKSGQPLSEVDALRAHAVAQQALLKWHWEYSQYVDGNLSAEEIPVRAYRAAWRGVGWANFNGFQEAWLSLKDQLRPDFVAWMEANVINQ